MRKLSWIFIVWITLAYGGEEPFKIYLSASGNDDSSGIILEDPINSLKRAQEILYEQRPTVPIEIHIKPGIYKKQSIVWKFSNNHSITFTSANFGKNRPIFDGAGLDRAWFRLNSSAGKSSNLKFRYIKVMNYKSGITFKGDRIHKSKYNSNNEIYGMWFDRIGQKFVNNKDANVTTSVINFINSRNNFVKYSYFTNILNRDDDPNAHAIHAIYIAHYSSNNKIIGNKFRTSNGDPIKVRDSSNNNYIAYNEFKTSGNTAFFLDSYCTTSMYCTKERDGGKPECPSVGNKFRYNNLYTGYKGRFLKAFKLDKGNDCGVEQISRLSTYKNVRH